MTTEGAERRIPYSYATREKLCDYRSVKSKIFYNNRRLLSIRETILSSPSTVITETLSFFSASRVTGEYETHTRFESMYYYSPDDYTVKIKREVYTAEGKVVEYTSTIENDVS